MVIKENSNVITIKLIRMYINDRIKYVEEMLDKTRDDEKAYTDHCLYLGRWRELEDFSLWFKEVHEVNEDYKED